MRKSKLVILFLCISYLSNAQTIVVDEDFESYTSDQPLAQQSNSRETWCATGGDPDDALVSNHFALSGSNSMLITRDKDMILPIGNYSSGHFVIEFNAYMIEQAYFNIMHTCKSSWAFDLYITSTNEIMYLDNPNTSMNSVSIDSYTNNEWVNIRFNINIDLDSVTTYINNIKRHQSVFSNAANGSIGNGLTCINFFGLDLFHGVDNSNYHIDDILITQLTSTNDTENLDKFEVSIFPNPSSETFKIVSDEKIKNISIYNCLGQELMNSKCSQVMTSHNLTMGYIKY
jgi:hypothetical protein